MAFYAHRRGPCRRHHQQTPSHSEDRLLALGLAKPNHRRQLVPALPWPPTDRYVAMSSEKWEDVGRGGKTNTAPARKRKGKGGKSKELSTGEREAQESVLRGAGIMTTPRELQPTMCVHLAWPVSPASYTRPAPWLGPCPQLAIPVPLLGLAVSPAMPVSHLFLAVTCRNTSR